MESSSSDDLAGFSAKRRNGAMFCVASPVRNRESSSRMTTLRYLLFFRGSVQCHAMYIALMNNDCDDVAALFTPFLAHSFGAITTAPWCSFAVGLVAQDWFNFGAIDLFFECRTSAHYPYQFTLVFSEKQ